MSKWSFIGNAKPATIRQIACDGRLFEAHVGAAVAFYGCIEPMIRKLHLA